MARDWTNARQKVLTEGRCRVCGSSEILDPAHIVPRSLSPKEGAMDAENIVPLCRDHHNEYDGHRLDLLPYLHREEEIHAVKLIGLERARSRITNESRNPKEQRERRNG